MRFNAAVLQGTHSQSVSVTEHKHEVNICIHGIQTSQLKEISTLVITHGEKNQTGNVVKYTVVQQICTLLYRVTFIACS